MELKYDMQIGDFVFYFEDEEDRNNFSDLYSTVMNGPTKGICQSDFGYLVYNPIEMAFTVYYSIMVEQETLVENIKTGVKFTCPADVLIIQQTAMYAPDVLKNLGISRDLFSGETVS